ncbi:MAG: helix-turn-helix domain-containing protein [Actinomycetota bacterium]|nr:helix-turn-helix domain-containing protein [Actinomycetota bacterium]
MTDRLVLSVSEAADALGVSDDLVYELTERGELPCLRFGRRKLIPRRAIESLVELAVVDFDPAGLIASLSGTTAPGVGQARGAVDLSALPRP